MTTVQRLGYVPALDGLRAVAISLVLSFHAFGWPPDGFLGVDMFFVLSGFLITTLLLEEHAEHGTVSLREFYRRRALRLLPALFAMLAICAPALALAGMNRELVVKGVGAGAFYVTNLAIGLGGLEAVGFGHLWSLSLEEQFYVLWPPLLFVVLRARIGIALAVVTAASVLVVAQQARLLEAGAPGHRLDWSPDTRSGGILIGCLTGLLLVRHRRLVLRASRWLFAIALTLGGLIVVENVGRGLYAGFLTLFAVCCAIVIVRVVDRPGLVGAVLATRPLRFVGRISYALYLWHIPVFFVFGIDTFDRFAYGGPVRKVAAIAVSVGCATASYYLVELPFLRRKRARSLGAVQCSSTGGRADVLSLEKRLNVLACAPVEVRLRRDEQRHRE